MQILPYNPEHINMFGLGCSRFARRYSGNRKNLLPGFNGLSEDRVLTRKKVPFIAFYSSRY